MEFHTGRHRVVIERVEPEIDCGRFAVKRTVGEWVTVEADIYADGHDAIACALLYRREDETVWTEAPMQPLANDRWRGDFQVRHLGRYRYTLLAWVDSFLSWRRDLIKRIEAANETLVDYQIGARLLLEAATAAAAGDAGRLRAWAELLARGEPDPDAKRSTVFSEELTQIMARYPDRTLSTRYPLELPVAVDRERARFSSWYEFFPRSAAAQPGRHATWADCERFLDYVASMGFDIAYLPPIHPIGVTGRKGRNNAPQAAPGDVGSPWGIGADSGGHKAVHPELGTLDEFRALVQKARDRGLEVALDIAFQCSPDHPYLRDHPEWFRKRPDGSVQYAENPPKKYQDIFPFDFETEHWQGLWEELKSVLLFWIDQGVRVFRVDNPHTKTFRFWEWVIADIKKDYPETVFLSEAFTRPKVMYHLAKLGFTQSYTYFAWRNTKQELTDYFAELTRSEVREFFRPSLWPNTPDILPEYLQFGGRPAFMARLALAATLGASYGIYGPAFELCEHVAREPGSEEYLNSEKYELRRWDLDHPESLRDFITRVNRLRRQNPALQSDGSLCFHHIENEQLICYSKRTDDFSNVVLVVVNLDPHHTQSGWAHLKLDELGVAPDTPFQAHDGLSEARYLWQGPRNYVQLDPASTPAHIFRIARRVRTERQFDYYM